MDENYSNETPWETLIAAMSGWIFMDLYIYFSYTSGQFAHVNPVELYSIGFYTFAIFAGAVGGTLFKFLTVSISGRIIHKKQMFEGLILGPIIGAVTIFTLYFISPLTSIIGLNISGSMATAAVTPLPLSITKFYNVVIPSTYILLLFIVVALAEEFMVLISFKSLEETLRSKRMGLAFSIMISLLVVGSFWALSHIPAYSMEGVPLFSGLMEALIIGTIAFRYLSFVFWHDLNFSYMVSAHATYDILLVTAIPQLSLVPVSIINGAGYVAASSMHVLAATGNLLPHLVSIL